MKKNTDKKNITKKAITLSVGGTLLIALIIASLVGGKNDKQNATTETTTVSAVESVTESTMVLDVANDGEGSVNADISRNGDVFTVTIGGEVYTITYNATTGVYTSDKDIFVSESSLVDGNSIYLIVREEDMVSKSGMRTTDNKMMNMGKTFVIKETEKAENVKEDTENSVIYKVIFETGSDVEEAVSTKTDETTEDEEVNTENNSSSNQQSPNVPKPPTTETTKPTTETTKPTTEEEEKPTTTETTKPTTEEVTTQATTETRTEATTETTVPTPKPPTTETTKPTTEATTTEAGCKHNWVAETKIEYVYDHSDHICKYCGYTTTNQSDINNHISNCGGYWTHEELISAGYTEEDTVYKMRVGRPKGTTYTTKSVYNEIVVETGVYYCDKCWTTK